MFLQSVLTGDFTHIYSLDPALDRESDNFDFEKWCETHDDEFLPRKEGARPTEFRLTRLTSKQRMFLRDIGSQPGIHTMAWWAVALCLKDVRPTATVDGKPMEFDRVNDNGWFRASDMYMDLICQVDDVQLLIELFTRLQQESTPSPRS